MALYDGRLKHVKDSDLFFWDGGQPSSSLASLASAVSSESEIVDLGAAQAFTDIPVSIHFAMSANVSILSSAVLPTGGAYLRGGDGMTWDGIIVQDAADGSTFSAILFIPYPYAGSAVYATAMNLMNVGICSCRRYLQLKQTAGWGGTATLKAWLRMGLTE